MSTVIDDALALLTTRYIFPEKAQAAAVAIRRRQEAGEYDGLDEEKLAERLTAELFEVCADKHLRVRTRPPEMHASLTEAELITAYKESVRTANYGIARVERLDGNIGYLDLRQIADASVGGRAIAAAMELVSHTEALILDLRRNRGGSPNGVTFWLSYLFADDMTHLNNIYDGESGGTRQFWSLAYLPGERYPDRPVWVLISDVTFSAGEEFCYNLQVLERATLIGRTTRGGAHPTQFFPLTPTLEITVPTARSVNPMTGGNWEGTGVVPDVDVPAEEAFDIAYRRALDHVLTTTAPATVLAEARAALEDRS
ncbi:S41 family peptidase [Actinoplanes friuliensis]|uniref:Retinol-binding protein 3 n=1 Tax=Actinoplanes friuliensis DSM 7358 TaxID=1246995 RepID=U5VYT4_9ACTN|nr:S41 family peptidase [Actinoplanes friuliensis]AGZ41947.1 Retinol-binding protein 3 [Actinoplanes friuliensis DSM 7358]